MRLFRRKQAEPSHETQAAPAADARLLDEQALQLALAAHVEGSSSAGRAFCVLCVLPQLLPDERVRRAEAQIVTGAIAAQLRDGDEAGAITGGGYLVILPGSAFAQAQVVAHRLATEFTVRSAHVNRRNWRVGIAAFPEDGLAPETLVAAAIAAAKRGSRAA